MAGKKIDRRALKTRKAITDSLAELLVKKELRNITVQELSDKADIHRVTFYKHFMDIYDVYEQMEESVTSEMNELIKEHGNKPVFEIYPLIFKYIEENPKLFKMIFSPNNTALLRVKVNDVFTRLCRKVWAERCGSNIDDKTLDEIILYHSTGCMAIIAKWVLTDYKESRDFIIKVLSELDKNAEKLLEK
jgi:AcrR family transcriptional regulator